MTTGRPSVEQIAERLAPVLARDRAFLYPVHYRQEVRAGWSMTSGGKNKPYAILSPRNDGGIELTLRVGRDSGLIGNGGPLKPLANAKWQDADRDLGSVSIPPVPPELPVWVARAARFTLDKYRTRISLTGRGDSNVTLRAEEAVEGAASGQESYQPEGVDRRDLVERQIRDRRGQRPFRDALRKRFRERCAVTGCRILAVLEAAHIGPYRGENDNHPANGLLLRADIHTLFDLNLLGIEPKQLRIELHPAIAGHYGKLTGRSLRCPDGVRPSQEALAARYEQFCRRREQPA